MEQIFYRKQSLDAPDQRPATADISGVSVIRRPDTCGWRMRMEKCGKTKKKKKKRKRENADSKKKEKKESKQTSM